MINYNIKAEESPSTRLLCSLKFGECKEPPRIPPGESIYSHQNGLDNNSIRKDFAENSAESPLYI